MIDLRYYRKYDPELWYPILVPRSSVGGCEIVEMQGKEIIRQNEIYFAQLHVYSISVLYSSHRNKKETS